MIYQINQGHWRQWGRKFINSSHEIKIPVAWNGKQHGFPGQIWCDVRWSRLIHWGRRKMMMYRIDKTDIENVNSFRLWDYHATPALVSYQDHWEGVILLKSVDECVLCVRSVEWYIVRDPFITKKSYIISSDERFIFTVLLIRVMHVAWNMNNNVRHKCTIKSGYCAPVLK